jgi:hypothetical protein
VLAAALRLHAFWAVGFATDARDHVPLRLEWPVHRGPVSRAHGPVHGVHTCWQPLDPRSTVRLRRFTLRVPGKFCIRMPILPPIKILADRSWFLSLSPCLPRIMVLEVLFLCFGTVTLQF